MLGKPVRSSLKILRFHGKVFVPLNKNGRRFCVMSILHGINGVRMLNNSSRKTISLLINNKPERKLGSVPTTKVSTHHVAPDQGLQERQLRRWIRRLDEAQTLARLGVPVPPNLKRRLQNMWDIPTNEYQAVQQEQWGAARRLAYGRLTSLLRVEQQKKLQAWKDRVGTFSGACRWVRQEDAKPYVVQTPEGCVMTSRVTA